MESEGSAFFARVDEGFASLAALDPERWRLVDGEGSIEEIAARVWSAATGA
jgi:thymidylate kinase